MIQEKGKRLQIGRAADVLGSSERAFIDVAEKQQILYDEKIAVVQRSLLLLQVIPDWCFVQYSLLTGRSRIKALMP